MNEIKWESGAEFEMRKLTKYGHFHVYTKHGKIFATMEGDSRVFYWNPAATTAFPCAIQHSGNFLAPEGEYRGDPVNISCGDWTAYPYREFFYITIDAGLGHRSNFLPDLSDVLRALQGKNAEWERRNPECGKNNEWIKME